MTLKALVAQLEQICKEKPELATFEVVRINPDDWFEGVWKAVGTVKGRIVGNQEKKQVAIR